MKKRIAIKIQKRNFLYVVYTELRKRGDEDYKSKYFKGRHKYNKYLMQKSHDYLQRLVNKYHNKHKSYLQRWK